MLFIAQPPPKVKERVSEQVIFEYECVFFFVGIEAPAVLQKHDECYCHQFFIFFGVIWFGLVSLNFRQSSFIHSFMSECECECVRMRRVSSAKHKLIMPQSFCILFILTVDFISEMSKHTPQRSPSTKSEKIKSPLKYRCREKENESDRKSTAHKN